MNKLEHCEILEFHLGGYVGLEKLNIKREYELNVGKLVVVIRTAYYSRLVE